MPEEVIMPFSIDTVISSFQFEKHELLTSYKRDMHSVYGKHTLSKVHMHVFPAASPTCSYIACALFMYNFNYDALRMHAYYCKVQTQ